MTRVETACVITAIFLAAAFPWPMLLIAGIIAALLAGVLAGIWHDLTPLWRGEPLSPDEEMER